MCEIQIPAGRLMMKAVVGVEVEVEVEVEAEAENFQKQVEQTRPDP